MFRRWALALNLLRQATSKERRDNWRSSFILCHLIEKEKWPRSEKISQAKVIDQQTRDTSKIKFKVEAGLKLAPIKQQIFGFVRLWSSIPQRMAGEKWHLRLNSQLWEGLLKIIQTSVSFTLQDKDFCAFSWKASLWQPRLLGARMVCKNFHCPGKRWGKKSDSVADMWQYWPCFETFSENKAVFTSKGGVICPEMFCLLKFKKRCLVKKWTQIILCWVGNTITLTPLPFSWAVYQQIHLCDTLTQWVHIVPSDWIQYDLFIWLVHRYLTEKQRRSCSAFKKLFQNFVPGS